MSKIMKYIVLLSLGIGVFSFPFFVLAGNMNPIYSSADLITEDTGTLSMESYASLASITGAELIGGNSESAVSLGRWTRGTQRADPYLPIAPYLTRELPSLWSMRISSKETPGSLVVRYELIGDNGHINCLSNTAHPDSEIPVNIYPMGSVIVSKGKNSNLVSGGVTLYLKTDGIRHTGKYSGTLVVIADHL